MLPPGVTSLIVKLNKRVDNTQTAFDIFKKRATEVMSDRGKEITTLKAEVKKLSDGTMPEGDK